MDGKSKQEGQNHDEIRDNTHLKKAEADRIDELDARFISTDRYKELSKKINELLERLNAVLTEEFVDVLREYDDLISEIESDRQEYFFHFGFVDGVRFAGQI